MEDIQERASSMKSWTALGLDMMSQLLSDATHPEYLTEGQTVLTVKDLQKGAIHPTTSI